VHPATVAVSGIVEYVEATFRPLTAEKDLRFSVWVADDVPPTLVSDQHRLQQVLRNLLSNAVKFTSFGEVTLVIRRSTESSFTTPALGVADGVLAFEVTDTGIGIPPEQLRTIFEAFQQADGTISRKFGGTGLGLSISREIARLIGGEIHVESEPERGSRFTLYVPTQFPAGRTGAVSLATTQVAPAPESAPGTERVQDQVEDDEDEIRPGDRLLLVALSEPELCRAAVEVGRSHGFKVLATTYADRALALAEQRQPAGMLIGMDMAAHDGSSLHHLLKRGERTRDVPLIAAHTPSAAETAHQGRQSGALDVLEVPLTRAKVDAALDRLEAFAGRVKRRLLVVTADAGSPGAAVAERVESLLGEVEVTLVGSPEDAVAHLGNGPLDCLLVDLALPDGGGFDVLRRVRARKQLVHTPVLVTHGHDLSARDEARLSRYAETLTIARPETIDDLMDAAALFLHQSDVAAREGERAAGDAEAEREQALAGRRILIVDDDVRNVFALTSALEQHGIDVLYAGNGEEGLGTLRREPEIDLVLMDVMMPGMDGYTAMREIRKMPKFRDLPVIALTAKAMPGDRDNSLTAGASDYVTKPVDVEQLLSVIRSWLS
jgi:CheY-like chemotaxis protein